MASTTSSRHPGEATTRDDDSSGEGSGSSTAGTSADLQDIYAANQTGRHFDLSLEQQPTRGLAAGLELSAFGRVPLQPAYVLRLRVSEEGRELAPDEYADLLPFFICTTALFERDDPPAEGQNEILRRADIVSRIGSEGEQVTTMVGQLVTGASLTPDLDGRPALFFAFGDLSVRIPGEFKIRFSLGQALPGAPLITSTTSDILSVYEEQDYALTPNLADTTLSRHLRFHGLPLYLPIQQQ